MIILESSCLSECLGQRQFMFSSVLWSADTNEREKREGKELIGKFLIA